MAYRFWWACTAFLFASGVNPDYFSVGDFYDHKRWVQLLWLYFTCGASLLQFFGEPSNVIFFSLSKLKQRAVCALFLLAIFSVILGGGGATSFRECLLWAALFTSGLFVASAVVADRRGFSFFCVCILAVLTLYIFKYVVALGAAIYLQQPVKASYLISGVLNINFAAQFLIFLVPLCWFFILHKNLNAIKFLMLMNLFFLWLLIFIAGYRGLGISILVMLVCTLALIRRKLLFFKINLAVFLLAVLVYILLLDVVASNEFNSGFSELVSSTRRLELWVESYKMFISHFWFGVGPNQFPYVLAEKDFSHPHNIYLQLLAELGFPFAVISGCLFYTFFSKGCRSALSKKGGDSVLRAVLTAAVVGVCTLGGVSGEFVMPIAQMGVVLSMGMFGAILVYRVDGVLKTSGTGLVARRVYGCFLVFLLLAFTSTIYKTSFGQYECVYNPGPRFWSYGGVTRCASDL
ncbi:O-antigen ligase family protein [Teredinibacter turnerae]|uniref:O-antigen ligase family protein n=1 Tax=Teredinibacter turnerae TaxID=2426 RepID=UPI001E46B510|nr:O-antigen ligase family protein [Teredinibacter turnerae]